MNQLKNTLAILLVFALAITGINVGITQADAENPLTVYGDAVTAVPGKEVKIPIMVKDNHGVAGLALKVTYDAAVMTPVKAEKGSLLSGLANLQFGDTIANHMGNSFECVAYNDSNFSDNGELLVLTFQTAANAAAGSCALKLELTEHYNEALTDIEAGCEDVAVAVGGDGASNASPAPNVPSANSFDVFIDYEGKDVSEITTSYDAGNSIKISRNGSHKISYKVKKTAVDIKYLILLTKLVTIPDDFAITPKTLTVGKASYDLGVCDVVHGITTDYIGASIRNPYLQHDENEIINQALGDKVIPVKAGDTITVEFDVSGIEKLDMSKNPDASAVKKPTSTPTKKPATTPTKKPSSSTPSYSYSSGTKTKKHKLIKKPGRVKIKKIKKSGKRCAKVTWGKVKCTDGYQIQYARKKSFSGKKKTTSYGRWTYIFGKSKKTYYVRVRAVNWGYVSQSRYGYKYGSWSKVKKIKLK